MIIGQKNTGKKRESWIFKAKMRRVMEAGIKKWTNNEQRQRAHGAQKIKRRFIPDPVLPL
jgi:hypothetical protein